MTAIESATQALLHARRTQQPTSAAAVPLPDAEAAYAVQRAVASALGWFGAAFPAYWKSGGPSRTATTTHAPLPPPGVWASPADARAWPFHFRGIEAEVALRLGREVGPELAGRLDLAAATALVDAMCVSIEIVDSRWLEAREAPPLAKLADLQSHGALVLGAWAPFDPLAPPDWAAQRCALTIGGGASQAFRGTHAMADPAFVLPAWLRHATRGGRTVPAGTVVTTGTWCGLPLAAAGDRVRVEFPGIGHAEVQL
ncbi:MAG: fumarylacetoacetate hydrolase family protein [Rubrivivax sp.]|nr:fumarylacetoacetate hydrolase family protein [Rubrivivax sp.]